MYSNNIIFVLCSILIVSHSFQRYFKVINSNYNNNVIFSRIIPIVKNKISINYVMSDIEYMDFFNEKNKTNRRILDYNLSKNLIVGYNNYLDKTNTKRLEKIFYLKNNKYSPYKTNKYYIKNLIQNITNTQNVINTKMNITQLLFSIQSEINKNNEDKIQSEYNSIKKLEELEKLNKYIDSNIGDNTVFAYNTKQNKDGYVDPLGIFRYKNQKIFTSNENYNPSQKKAKKHEETSNGDTFQIVKNVDVSFNDVGGYENIKNELLQTADILINYNKYIKYNVRTPKGIIFEGPPGNGKTLLAKAFAGELNISFIPVSGSEFSEKYVGVGASRVRELFTLAENNKPCIIFIDEIDAVARKRGNDAVSSNSEKDQTLNQLLINLDGFKKSNGVFVIGATNRVDLLDSALMRPGRMDKNIYIGNPDAKTRHSILQIHMQGKPISSNIIVENLIEMTAGFSGAQIENLLNESMLKSLRDNREMILIDDLEYIINRIIAGWQSVESSYSDSMIQHIVIHELGHAMVGFFSKEHPKLMKVLLNLLSPKTPGYTIFDTSDNNINIYTKSELFSHLTVLLGGRIAEELFFGISEITTGAKKDLEEAHKLAQNMVLQYGMGNQYIYPDLSEQSKFIIDQEVNELLIKANVAATIIIKNTTSLIQECSHILLRDKVLKPEQIIEKIQNLKIKAHETTLNFTYKNKDIMSKYCNSLYNNNNTSLLKNIIL